MEGVQKVSTEGGQKVSHDFDVVQRGSKIGRFRRAKGFNVGYSHNKFKGFERFL